MLWRAEGWCGNYRREDKMCAMMTNNMCQHYYVCIILVTHSLGYECGTTYTSNTNKWSAWKVSEMLLYMLILYSLWATRQRYLATIYIYVFPNIFGNNRFPRRALEGVAIPLVRVLALIHRYRYKAGYSTVDAGRSHRENESNEWYMYRASSYF